VDSEKPPWSTDEFEGRLRELGRLYHIHHPYHRLMADGALTPEQIRGWVANRFYYQISIPRKDAALLANCPDQHVRRQWLQRILDHDGQRGSEGGIEAWLRLGEACGLEREEMLSMERVLPGVRFAVDAYVSFVARSDWRDGVCSSLTELFAPTIHKQRIQGWPDQYPWIGREGLTYFRNRLGEAHRDVAHGMDIVFRHFRTREQQERALEILRFKLEVLWTMADAMYHAYVTGMPPFFNTEEDEWPRVSTGPR
jgi:pyrroloquinoline-quinone synthase